MDNREIRRVFDQVRLDPEREETMLERLLGEERKVTPMRKLKKMTVIGVAAALMIMACAAAVVTGIDQKILGYFNIAPEQAPLMSPTAIRVEKSHTYDNGWTVEFRQALTDRYSLAVLVDVTAPEGTRLNGEESYLKIEPARKPGGYGYGSHYLKDETLADNQASYLFLLTYDDDDSDIIGITWDLTPQSYLCVEQDGSSREIALEDWTCKLSLSKQDPGVVYELDQPIDIDGDDLTLEQVYLSPISVVFRLQNGSSSLGDNSSYFFNGDWQDQIILHLNSGETVRMGDRHMGGISNSDPGGDPDATYAHFQFSPEKVIDPAEIVSVTLYGQTYELK